MSQDEVEAVEKFLAQNPTAGEEMPGTGGCRKLRWAKPGKGKSGGYRVITFFSGSRVPVFLITVFGKNERANLNKTERNTLRGMTKELVGTYAKRVGKVGTG